MSASIQSITIGPSGKTLIVRFEDGSNVPTNLTALIFDDQQAVTVLAAGGTFTISFDGQTTGAIAYGADPGVVQSALEALSTIGSGNVAVAGIKVYAVRFLGTKTNTAQPSITVDGAGLLSVPVGTPTTAGGTAAFFIDDVTPNFTTVGSWNSFTGQANLFNGTVHTLGVTGLGISSCTWQATGLGAGCYLVEIHHLTSFDRPNAAIFRLYDGTTFRQAVTVDLTQTPTGTTNYNDTLGNPYPFSVLANVYVGGGTLRVVWYDDCSNPNVSFTNMAVDAVRVSPQAASGAPPDVTVVAQAVHTFVGGPPTISVNGGAAVTLPNAIWSNGTGERSLPYCIFLLPSLVQATDTITFTAQAGWAIAAAGPLPASSSLAVANSAGTPLLPQSVSGTKTLAVGWNTQMPDYTGVAMYTANLMKGAGFWSASSPVDANGWFVPSDNSHAYCPVLGPTDALPLDSHGWPVMPPMPGQADVDYTLMWDGPGNALISFSTPYVELTGQAVITGTTDNKRVFRVSPSTTGEYAPSINLDVYGSTTNIRIWPPGVATDGSQLFHPEYLRMLAGSKMLRAMAPFHAGVSNVQNYADYGKLTQRSYSNADERYLNLTIQSIAAYEQPILYYAAQRGLLVTTTTAHGFCAGQNITFRGPGNGPLILQVDTDSGASTIDLNGWHWNIWYDSAQMNTNQFIFFVPGAVNNGANPRLSATYTGGGTIFMNRGAMLPPEEHVDLCNAVGADCWMNVEQTATDACVTQLAQMIATRLSPGRKVAVELSNEHWNTGFMQASHFEGMARVWGYSSSSVAFARITAHVHDLFAAEFATAGRGGDLIRVFGGFIYGENNTQDMANYCFANGKVIDWLAVAPYYRNGPIDPTGLGTAALDALTIDQVLDACEVWIEYGNGSDSSHITGHYAVLSPHFPNAKVVAYECGPGSGYLGGSTNLIKIMQTQGWHRHPRQRGIVFRDLQKLQDTGLALGNFYTLAGPNSGTDAYGAYFAWNQPAGIGDGSDGKFDNRTALFDLSRVVSVVGGAVDAWDALVGTTTSATVRSRHAISHLASECPLLGPLATSGVIPSGTTPLDPSSLTGLVLWLKADALSLSEGDPVSSWSDASGQGHNFTASGVGRPTFRAAVLNGKPVVAFDGTANVMSSAVQVTTAVNNFSLIAVVAQQAGQASYGFFFYNGVYDGGNGYGLALKTYADLSIGFLYNGGGPWVQSNFTAVVGQYYIIENIRTAGTPTLHVDGTEATLIPEFQAIGAPPSVPNTATYLGSGGGTTLPGAVRIAEILVYEQALSGADRVAIESYLNAKYSIY